MKSLKNINFYATISSMKWFVLGLILLSSWTTAFALNFAADKEPAVSTQGIELIENIDKSKPSIEEKNEQKALNNRSKKYIRYNKQLNRKNSQKEEKLKELEYLQQRLEIKKTKLETKFPTEVKGEEE